MVKWLWYSGWLIGWFVVLWSLLFVPVSNLFLGDGAIYGAIRGLILFSGMVVLFYGFRYINRKFRIAEHESAVPDGNFAAVVERGVSAREAAFIAANRDPTLAGTSPKGADDGSRAIAAPRAALDVERKNAHQGPAVGGVMKSAGNPLVRKAFARAMKEVETKTYDTGLWAMALVECNGDERAARLAYMKARAADIAWADAKAAESAQQSKRAT